MPAKKSPGVAGRRDRVGASPWGHHGQPDRTYRSRATDQLKRGCARSTARSRCRPSEEIQRPLPRADLRRSPGPGFHPACRSCSAGRVPVMEATSFMSTDPIRNSPKALLAAAPSPQGPELVFHDPLHASGPEQQPVRSRVPAITLHGSPELNPKRLTNKRPATRADRLEAVSRDLRLLARGRGSSAG